MSTSQAEYKGEDKTKPDPATSEEGEGLTTNARGDTQHSGSLQVSRRQMPPWFVAH
jgi:hypothetical protein